MARPVRIALLCIIAASVLSFDVNATICLATDKQHMLHDPALIFQGTPLFSQCAENQWKTTYKVHTVYKGVVHGDTVVLSSESINDDCRPIVNHEKTFVAAYYASPNSNRGSELVIDDCTTYSLANYTLTYLPMLDSYRKKIYNLYRQIDLHPQSATLWNRLLIEQAKHSDYVGALESINKLKKIGKLKFSQRLELANVFYGLGRYEEALARYRKLLIGNPSDKAVIGGLTRTLIALERFSEIDPNWRDFSNVHINGVSWSRRELASANFSNSHIDDSDLEGANLMSADLSTTYIFGSNLSHANLSGANLHRASFNDSKLEFINLSGATLSSASLFGAKLINANLENTDLTAATLTEADLTGARITQGTKLLYTRLNEAQMPNIDLSNRNLSRAQLQGANLRGANLSNSNLQGAYLSGLPVEFRGEDDANRIRPADIRGANLSGADLSGADMRGVTYDCHTLFPDGFDPMELRKLDADDCPAN